MKKKLSILGSTGSIGRQTLEVVEAFPNDFEVTALAAGNNIDLLAEQVRKFHPQWVSTEKFEDGEALRKQLSDYAGKTGVAIGVGESGIEKAATLQGVDLVVLAIPGSILLRAALAAIENGRDVALASKEILVAGGDLVMALAKKMGVRILPIDSEHCALFQCLNGENIESVRRVVLTASGGPFRETSIPQLSKASVMDALNHPTWKMGKKISIDSATLMNKGFEVMEAHHLFGLSYDQIDVLIHPQSIVHSMVEFTDGSVMAQLAEPDMRIPIQYALFGGKRKSANWKKLHWDKFQNLRFEEADAKRYPCLGLAYQAGRTGGTAPAVLNAANERAVTLFLNGEIPFTDIAGIVSRVLEKHEIIQKSTLEQILEADRWARKEVEREKPVAV